MYPARHAHSHPGRARRRLLVLALVPVLMGGGSAALAYWTSVGAGQAEVGAVTALPLQISADLASPAGLYPGKTSDVTFLLSNSNAYPVRLSELTSVTVTSNDEAGCAGATYTSLPPAVSSGLSAGGYMLPTPIEVPAGSPATAALIEGLITMTTSAPDPCQGVVFTILLEFSGAQL